MVSFAQAQTTIHVPADQPTIQAGINAASTGDTVLVAPGTYYENIDFKGKAITVTSSDGASRTIIDGSNKGPTVAFKSAEVRSAVFSGFTVQHGGTSIYGAGLSGNGGLYVTKSSPSILNNVITQNECWGIESYAAAPSIQNNEISATQDSSKNCGPGSGAGIYIGGNRYDTGVGGVNGVPALIIGNTIENNVQSGLEDSGGNGGAAIAVWGGSPVIQGNTLRNNYSPGGTGGAINVAGGAGTTITQNLIYGNRADCGGGAIAFIGGNVGPGFQILITSNTIVDNTGQSTAGYSDCSNIAQIYPNPEGYGNSGPTAVIVNNIISGSTSNPSVDCAQLFDQDQASLPIFDHNIVYNSGAQFFGSRCADVSSQHGNVAADPQFIDSAHFNYRLKPTSPGIDAGNTSVLQTLAALTSTPLTKDFDGNQRVQDATGKGYPIIDMGAYEYTGSADAAPTTIVLTSSSYTGNAGPNFNLTATLASAAGTPTGSVNFFMDGNGIGAAPIDSSGTATLTNTNITPGIHILYAQYPGQASFTPATSVIIVLFITRYSTTLKLTSTPNPSLVGQPVIFTVQASSGDGTVPSPITLTDFGSYSTLATLIPDSSGEATFTTSSLTLGSHLIQTMFAGNATDSNASATLTQTVTNGYATTTNLTSSLNPSTYGQPVTFTSHITSANGTPTGSVTFTDRQTTLGTAPVDTNGNASVTTSTLTANNLANGQSHTIAATFTPTGTFAGSSATLSQVVNGLPTVTALTISPGSGTSATTFAMTATVVPASPGNTTPPTGNVYFYSSAQTGVAGNLLGYAPVANGIATFSSTGLLSGSDFVTAVYFGDTIYAQSTSVPFVLTVTAAPTTLVLTPHANPAPALLSSYTFIASLYSGTTPLAGQPVVITIQGQPPATVTTDASGSAAFTTPYTLHTGSYVISGAFAGGSGYAASASTPFAEQIFPDRTSVTLTGSPSTIPQGATLPLTATVLDIDTGNAFTSGAAASNGKLNFYDGTNLVASLAPQGSSAMQATAQSVFSSLAIGTHTLMAAFVPATGDIAASTSAPLVITVTPQDFSFTSSAPSITIQTEHHASLQLTLASIGGFAGPIALSCAPRLPPDLTCELPTTPISLGANATLPITLTLDTDAVLGYISLVRQPTPGTNSSAEPARLALSSFTAPSALHAGQRTSQRRSNPLAPIAFAFALPLGLLGLSPQRRRFWALKLLPLAIIAILSAGLTSCSGKYPAHTPPGTYIIPITATATSAGSAPITHTLNLTLVVTP